MQLACRKALLTLSFFFFTVSFCNAAAPIPMGMVTGGSSGTYYQFGLNIAELVQDKGIRLQVAPSSGSVENVYAVFKRPRTQLGIVQADVLAFVSRMETDSVLKQIARKIKLVFPLYNEEIHLVGREELGAFDGLEGQKVAIGKEGSGTYLTARLLFELSGVTPEQMVTVGTDQALAELKAGRIDAMFYVAGYPVKLFAEQIGEGDGLALLPIRNAAIGEFYPAVEIPAGTYSWQSDLVSTMAVKAVLVSYNFRNRNCENVGKVGRYIYENLEWLRENGHPKWKAVDLDVPLKGWEQYDCVSNRLAGLHHAERAERFNPVLEAIKEVLQE